MAVNHADSALDGLFSENRPNYTDEDFDKIASLLKRSTASKYAGTPRLYTLLRIVDQLGHVDHFLKHGLSDRSFPFTLERLPAELRPSMNVKFIANQHIVCDSSEAVQLMGTRRHMNFKTTPSWIRSEGMIAPFGELSEVDKVSCGLEAQLYARKRYPRPRWGSRDRETLRHFENEVENMKKLVHHHCIEVVASYTDSQFFALIMSPVAECNLAKYLELADRSEDKRSLLPRFFGCLSRALWFIHSKELRHRDIKTENILVSENNVLFTDFDCSYNWSEAKRSTTSKPHRNTFRWASPELASPRTNGNRINTSSDIWSLGCVFLEMITVVKGKSVKDLEKYFTDSVGDLSFHMNLESITRWTKELQVIVTDDRHNELLESIQKTLQADQNARPTAHQLVQETDKPHNRLYFCCEKCLAEDNFNLNGEDSLVSEHLEEGREDTDAERRHVIQRMSDSVLSPDGKTRTGERTLTKNSYSQSVENATGDKSAVQLLLRNGFDTKGSDLRGSKRVGLHWAALHGHSAVVQLLLENMADPECKAQSDETALHAAASKGHGTVVRLLAESGADLEAKDNLGWTPLHRAARSGQIKVLELLLDLGADMNARGHQMFTILHSVASEGTYGMAEILLQKGADVSATDEYGIKPLARLADKNYGWWPPYRKRDDWDEALAQLLIRHGADVNARDCWGATALHRAAAQGNVRMIKILLDSGADVTKKTNDGETPFDWAKNHEEARGLLKAPVRPEDDYFVVEKGEIPAEDENAVQPPRREGFGIEGSDLGGSASVKLHRAAFYGLSHHDYTVGWICALPLEMAAAKAMLDDTHRDLPIHPNDNNTYTLGRIGAHNIVVACLPSGVYGTTSATTVATQMLSSFKSIRFGLMVGIGGGVPSVGADIRLGDIVVSKPTKNSGGVVQYDYGKAVRDGRVQCTGILNNPPQALLTAIAKVQADHMLDDSRIPAYLSQMMANRPTKMSKFTHRGQQQDRLFQADYDHIGSGDTCDDCDPSRLVARPARTTDNPMVHYGPIASGNQVMKHGGTRDMISRALGVLCFEMEAAGLMNSFPCLVIRGICDYADSHKNKQWQEYAAATAAAYAKELLSVIPGSQVARTPTVVTTTSSTGETLFPGV